MRTENCPFCGQPLKERELVDAYKEFFSVAYRSLAERVKQARDSLTRYKNGEFREKITGTHDQNEGLFKYWEEVGKLDIPDLGNFDEIIVQLENTTTHLDSLFHRKQTNLIEPVIDDMGLLSNWEEERNKVLTANGKVEAFLEKIKELKDSIDPSSLPQLEMELGVLHATKRRHDTDMIELAERMTFYQLKRQEIAEEKVEVRGALDLHIQETTAKVGESINGYLKRLGAGFRIDYQEPDYRGKEPTAQYHILINEVPVLPRNDAGEIAIPSFRNTLSAGDKSTLALALFLAKVNSDPNLNDTIVVLDDPFTSLDHFRRQFTAIEIRKLCGLASQIIVLSHEKYFLRLLWDKIDQSIIRALALQTGAPGITTISPFDIPTETQPRYLTERMEIEEFVEGESHGRSYIRTRLRTVCEDFYRKGDPSLFHEASSLEEIIRLLKTAPEDHPYKGAIEDLIDLNEYSRSDSHAEIQGNPFEETSVEELKEFCRRVLELTHGM
jgi:wobble nucleotide-excising tRNase